MKEGKEREVFSFGIWCFVGFGFGANFGLRVQESQVGFGDVLAVDDENAVCVDGRGAGVGVDDDFVVVRSGRGREGVGQIRNGARKELLPGVSGIKEPPIAKEGIGSGNGRRISSCDGDGVFGFRDFAPVYAIFPGGLFKAGVGGEA